MKSLDTNILIYAANRGCQEHESAFLVLQDLLKNPAEWIIADQVMFEYLRALSSPAVFAKPLKPTQAIEVVRSFRQSSGVLFCAYEQRLFNGILDHYGQGGKKRLYDIVLSQTLLQAGVREFFTRNVKDFKGTGIETIVNPIDI